MKSAVIVTRNDNYGGNLAERASHCLNSLCSIFDEVILVDWNSPKQPLIDQIYRDVDAKKRLLSVVIKPKLVTEILNGRPSAEVCEVLGRNIGLRLAKHTWVLSTNIDIVIPDNFDESILDGRTFYTSARFDVPKQAWLNKTHSELIGLLSNGSFPRKPEWSEDSFSLVAYCGDFQLAHTYVWNMIRGFEERMLGRCYADSNVQLKAKLAKVTLAQLQYIKAYHLSHDSISYYYNCIKTYKNNKRTFLEQFKETVNDEFWGCVKYHSKFKIEQL